MIRFRSRFRESEPKEKLWRLTPAEDVLVGHNTDEIVAHNDRGDGAWKVEKRKTGQRGGEKEMASCLVLLPFRRRPAAAANTGPFPSRR